MWYEIRLIFFFFFAWFFISIYLSFELLLLGAHGPLIRLYNKQISNLHSAQSHRNW